ncbi:2,3-bisphosphoglycerate-independent phosphoglycerate mutase [Desulfovirgula thermocuniculi]|uniref:2,3-bisphosphoglycerate-independent phosphoglycerate mutase n=1 Tax=Desulfovirgula thermocuniculi TaxID=348842 RepID=UPI0004173C1E|nr:2,3-bisphosphoglycerate-independent phosphoglycerate mutase [Desulfovirgula thermocuniculi]
MQPVHQVLSALAQPAETKLVLVVLDGLGGLPAAELNGLTELEAAHTPNLDQLARRSSLGLIDPVLPGVTPGSSAGHLALFGYEPLEWVIGRGILEALGTGFNPGPGDVAVRGNFATVKYENGTPVVVDRRAGRPTTAHTARACARLQESIPRIGDVEVIVLPVKEHRFAVIFRGPGLDERVADTDPQKEGKTPLPPQALCEAASKTAAVAAEFVSRAAEVLKDEPGTNYVLLRGFSSKPDLPPLGDLYHLKAAAIAVYPMYRGLAALAGMDILSFPGERIADELAALKANWESYDYFFIHIKATDSRGEDGNARGKVAVLEEFDRYLPQLLDLKPDVLVITGDHSTPASLKSHSWHPVPLLLHSPWVLPDSDASGFNERACQRGSLGHLRAVNVMGLMLAHGRRLAKFSA